jgi:predicted DNA binding CopG/RHH family protein
MLRFAILLGMSKDTQLNIRVEKDLVARLKKQAEIEVTTPSQLVRKAVTIYLREALSDS